MSKFSKKTSKARLIGATNSRSAVRLAVRAGLMLLMLAIGGRSSALAQASGATEGNADIRPAKPLAVVYAGPGACVIDGCERAAGAIAEGAGFRVRYVQPYDVKGSLLRSAKVWIQPGGNAIDASRALGEKRMAMMREFIFDGGRYLGFCAGGYLADERVDDPQSQQPPTRGLAIISAETYEIMSSQEPMLLPVRWLGQTRNMYFQGGPAFRLKSPSAVSVIAQYMDLSPAAIMENYGSGRVAVTGPHPEAPQFWFEADHLPKPDGLDTHLAEDLLRRLFAQ